MTPYLLVLVLAVGVAYLGRVSNRKQLQRLSLWLIVLLTVGFAGLRDGSVGTDTGNYVRRFHAADSASHITQSTEVGYNLLNWASRGLSDSYAMILTMVALIVVVSYLSTMVRLVRRYETALFAFICLGVYTFFFNGARQGIAAAICFAALPLLLERKALPYFLAVGVAALFHHSALVALPLYYLATPRLHLSRVLLLATLAIGLTVFLNIFVGLSANLLSDKYATYGVQGEGGGEVMAAFLVCQGIALWSLRGRMGAHRAQYTVLLNIYLIGLIPVLASVLSSVNPSGVLRLHMYFMPVAILMWPVVFRQVVDPGERNIIGIAFASFMVIYFILTTTTFSRLVPYRVNLELLAW